MNQTILQQFKNWKNNNLSKKELNTLICNLSEVLSKYEPEIFEIIIKDTE